MLRLTNRALRRLEDTHGIDLYNGGLADVDLKAEGLAPFVKIYWAGRLHEQPNLTMEQAQADADEMTPGELMHACNEAVKAAFGITSEAEPAVDTEDKSIQAK